MIANETALYQRQNDIEVNKFRSTQALDNMQYPKNTVI